MRFFLRIVGLLAVIVFACTIGLLAWLYFYTSDLPPASQLSSFKGVSEAEAQFRSCEGDERRIPVVPREKLGRYTVASLIAAEGRPDARSPFIALLFPAKQQHTVQYQVQLARSLVCGGCSELSRLFQELRLANAINRRFDQQDLLTIYLNRIYFGPDVYGIEAAAQKYLGKHASDLTLAESAAIVAMIRSPRAYSPRLHPDRAAERRNLILEEMAVEGSVSWDDANRAKAAPIRFLEQ